MKRTFSRFLPLLTALVAAAAALFLFRPALAPGHSLLSPDSQIFGFPYWRDFALVSFVGGRYEIPTFDMPLYWLLPLPVASTVAYVLSTALLALGVSLYLRHWNCPPAAALLGGLSLAFSGYHFTLFSAGHRGYFIMMAYAVFLLCAIDRMVETGRWPYFVFAAVCAVSALRPQPDVFALWCGLLAPYAALRAALRLRALPHAARPRLAARWAAGIAVAALTALLFGYPAIRYTLTDVVAGREAQIAAGSPTPRASADDSGDTTAAASAAAEARWDFATSWSLPPAELPELVCANLRGYDSGNPDGPYWGSLGRSVHYAETKQGFFNFRQHTLYLGAIPLAFALFAALSLLPLRRGAGPGAADSGAGPTPAETRAVAAFWVAVALGSLVLALGRHTPAYRLFYSLPMMSGIRGPVKFLHFTETAVAILAGFGFARLLRGDGPRAARAAAVAAAAVALLLLGATLRDPPALSAALSAMGVPEASAASLRTILVGIRAKTLLLSALFFGIGAAALLLRARWKTLPPWVAYLFVAAALCDAMRAAAPYVNPVDVRVLIPPNALVESLRKSGQLEASAWAGNAGGLVSYQPFLNSFEKPELSYIDPGAWQNPDSPPIVAARRFRPDDVLRRWQFFGTRLVIVPMEQYDAMPQGTPEFTKLGSYAFTRAGVVPAPAGQAQFGALVLRNWTPNASVFTRWESVPDNEAAWAKISDPSFDLSRRLVVVGPAPECPGATGRGTLPAKSKTVVGEVAGRHRRLVFETAADSPEGLLFFRNQFGGLREMDAFVDGAPAAILPANVYFRAVPVPAGRHTVEIRLRLHRWIAAAYAATALLLLAAVAATAKNRQGNTDMTTWVH